MGQPAVAIPEKIFFKIGEVCDILDVQAHVLRYWETEFPQLSPQKNRSGQRTYRRRDVEIALRIKELLYEDLYTIAGAKKKLQIELRESSRLKIVHSEQPKPETRLKAVGLPEMPVDSDELEIENFEDDYEEFSDSESDELPDADNHPEFDDERREALKNLASQLLELREMLKPNFNGAVEKQARHKF